MGSEVGRRVPDSLERQQLVRLMLAGNLSDEEIARGAGCSRGYVAQQRLGFRAVVPGVLEAARALAAPRVEELLAPAGADGA